MKRAIRRWLGVDDIIYKHSDYVNKILRTKTDGIQKSVAAAHDKIAKLTEAGDQLESTIAALDQGNALLHLESAERFDAFRAINGVVRSDLNTIGQELKNLSANSKAIDARLQKVEFPGFEPVEASLKKDA
jgi:prefoldin subunit 5